MISWVLKRQEYCAKWSPQSLLLNVFADSPVSKPRAENRKNTYSYSFLPSRLPGGSYSLYLSKRGIQERGGTREHGIEDERTKVVSTTSTKGGCFKHQTP